MASQAVEGVDFFSLLPPEVVLAVILNLCAETVLTCLRVSKTWCAILDDFEPYWRKSCTALGLSQRVISKLQDHHPSSKAFFLVARRQRWLLCATPPSYRTLSGGYPYDVHYVCQCARGDRMVGTVYHDFKPHLILVEKLQNNMVSRTHTFRPQFAKVAQNRIIWSRFRRDFMLCATASGLWSGYNLTQGSMLFQWAAEEPMYDSEIRIGCCDKCFTVCVAKLVSSRNEQTFWELRVIKIGRISQQDAPKIMKFRLLLDPKFEVTTRRATSASKKVHLMSNSTQTNSGDFCDSHTLFLQWAHTIWAHKLVFERENSTSLLENPDPPFSIGCKREHLDLAIARCHGLNTEFNFSEDLRLLGMIFQSTLVVWDVATAEEVSFCGIVLKKYNHEQIRLIALGHVYSIVGLEFSNTLLVVMTHTGEIVLECSGFADKHCSMVPPYIEFLASSREDWLSDVSRSPVSTVVTYWNKTNRSVEGVFIGQQIQSDEADRTEVPQNRRRWWSRK